MVDTTKMMFSRPINCRYCGHGYYGLQHIVDYADQLYKWTLIDMTKEQANKDPIYAAIDEHDPASFTGFGHGNSNVFTGDAEQPIFTSDECGKLAGRIVYLLSCLTGQGLGPAIIENGGVAYAGFIISWTWMSGSGTDGDPYDDIYAHGFYESSNELWIALLDGCNFGEACQRSIDKYNEWIDYWMDSDDPGATDAIKWLAWDRDGLIGLGDLNATLIACTEITNKEDCLASGCFWWGEACHSELPPDVQDSKTIVIQAPLGHTVPENVKYPSQVYEGFEFEIKYDCRNTGGQTPICGHIKDLDTGQVIENTYWEETMPPDGVTTISTILGPIVKDMNLRIEVGHLARKYFLKVIS